MAERIQFLSLLQLNAHCNSSRAFCVSFGAPESLPVDSLRGGRAGRGPPARCPRQWRPFYGRAFAPVGAVATVALDRDGQSLPEPLAVMHPAAPKGGIDASANFFGCSGPLPRLAPPTPAASRLWRSISMEPGLFITTSNASLIMVFSIISVAQFPAMP
jgi:hypothetical protein